MLLGILCGIGIDFSIGFANLAEIIYIIYGLINIIKDKKIKLTKELKKYMICTTLLILYMLIYFWIDICDTSKIIKNIFKYLDIFIIVLIGFQHCQKDEKNFIKFLISFLSTKIIMFIFYNRNAMDMIHILHYSKFLLDIYIIITLFEKNTKTKTILYTISLILSLYSRSRTSLMIILITIIYRLYQNIMENNNTIKEIIKKLVIIIIMAIVGGIGINYFVENLSQTTESNSERTLLITTALKEIKQNPLNGVGPGNFNLYADMRLGIKFKSNDLTVHNYYLEVLTELGIIGFIIVFLYYGDIVKHLMKRNCDVKYKNIYLYFLVFQFFNTSSGDQRMETALMLALIFYDIGLKTMRSKKNEKCDYNS